MKVPTIARTVQEAIPALHNSPILRVGGSLYRQPPLTLLSCLHVDGSYKHNQNRDVATAAAAFHLKAANNEELFQKISIKASNSTEAEWASILFGLRSATENGERLLHIQNDCLGIIQSFIPYSRTPRHDYARMYKEQIVGLANQAQWVSISWIPREFNRADQVLR